MSRIQYVCQPINIAKGYEGREVSGRYSIIIITSSSLHSHCCFNLHATRQHKSCITEFFLPTSPHVPFKLQAQREGGALNHPPLHRSQRSNFSLTNDLKQSDLIIFFKSYSLEFNSERVNKPHGSQKTCFQLYVNALKRGVWYAYKAFTAC